jgi:hypothetical protein
MKTLFSVAALLVALTLGGCAPATRPIQLSPAARAEAARERFTVKTGETWQLTAFKPAVPQPQRFNLELYGNPEVQDGLLVAEAEAGTRDATLIYDPRDDSLLVGVFLTAGDDPELVFCAFDNAQAGKTAYKGESFYGKVSELRDDNIPDSRFAECNLERK